MKGFFAALLFMNFALCSQGYVDEQFKRLSHSKMRALYARHYDGYKKFVQKYKEGVVDKRPEPLRLLAYAKTVEKINRHNELYEQGKSTYKLGLNRMSDMTFEEMEQNTRVMHTTNNVKLRNITASASGLPKTIDWVKRGYVTPVKDLTNWCQSAGAALAVAGALEAVYKARTKRLVPLSAQELLDCNGSGCSRAGSPDELFAYVVENGGLQKEAKYRWAEGAVGQCQNNSKRFAPVRTFIEISADNCESLKAALTLGPVVVPIYASIPDFNDYKEGIYESHYRYPKDVYSRYMLAVGYGEDYFLLKTAQGKDWGLNGYMKISSDSTKNLNICLTGYLPLLRKYLH